VGSGVEKVLNYLKCLPSRHFEENAQDLAMLMGVKEFENDEKEEAAWNQIYIRKGSLACKLQMHPITHHVLILLYNVRRVKLPV
jgi:hypothetical protein